MSKLYINGKWINPIQNKLRDVINPSNGKVITTVAEADEQDVEVAVLAARTAFDKGPWADFKAVDRSTLLLKIADKLEENAVELAKLETEDNGKPLREAEFDIADAASCFRYYAGLATKPHGQTYEVVDDTRHLLLESQLVCAG